MRTSRIITLLLLLILFSFINEVEEKLTKQVSQWTLDQGKESIHSFNIPIEFNPGPLFFSTFK